MQQTAILSATVVLGFSLLQRCPAPPAIIPALIAGTGRIVGGIVQEVVENNKRGPMDDVLMPVYALKICEDQLAGVEVSVKETGEKQVLFEGVPPACMTLAASFVDTTQGVMPIPMGSDSVMYTEIGDEDFAEIKRALKVSEDK